VGYAQGSSILGLRSLYQSYHLDVPPVAVAKDMIVPCLLKTKYNKQNKQKPQQKNGSLIA